MILTDSQKFWLKLSSWTLSEASMFFAGIDPASCSLINPQTLENSAFSDFKGRHYSISGMPLEQDSSDLLAGSYEEWALLTVIYAENIRLLADNANWIEDDKPKNWIVRALAQGISINLMSNDITVLEEFFYINPLIATTKSEELSKRDQDLANLLKDIHNKNHDRYCPELVIAIEAWQKVVPKEKRSPKQSIAAWLDDNHPNLSTKAKERIVTMVNWKPRGGAPKSE